MLAGLDVGGTHTDAVLLDAESGRCLAFAKAPTRKDDVLPGLREALTALFSPPLPGKGVSGPDTTVRRDPSLVTRLTVSTTLGINALLTGNTAPVGMLVIPGPGIDPALFWGNGTQDRLFHVLSGAQDHRGRIVARPDSTEIAAAFSACAEHGARAFGIVCKFSPKNPELERELARIAADMFGADVPVVLGSSVSGRLNFPRRMHTVWCNAALASVSRAFGSALKEVASELGLSCPIRVLKADAGAFSLDEAIQDPAGTMGSGPAASLLGVWALSRGALEGSTVKPGTDACMVDMGGTSTDVALLAGGHPLLSREGLDAAGRPTLVRTLWTRSLALGGDSSLRVADGAAIIGPERSGPPLALGVSAGYPVERPPTLTDALNVLSLARIGETAVSRAALNRLASSPGCPDVARGDAIALSRLFLRQALERIRDTMAALLSEVNERPVYTIRELVISEALRPCEAIVIGGPAAALAAEAEAVLGLPVRAPEESAYANAVGAALARPTKSAELYADTVLGRMTIPDFGMERRIGKEYRLDDAKADMQAAFSADAASVSEGETMRKGGDDAQIVFAESFAMLDDRGDRGHILRVRAQRAAGLSL